MTFRSIAILFCIIVTVIIVAVFPISESAPAVSEQALADPAVPQASVAESKAATKPVDWDRFAAMAASRAMGGAQISTADYERFIAKHGDTPVNLIVIFDQSGDRKWLERALAAHPDSPIVLMAALTESPNATPEQRAAWLEKLKAAEPNNPVPWILSAQELFKAGRSAEAMKEAAAALERPAFYTYSQERIAAARALHESVGAHPLEAELLATFSLKMSLLQPAMATGKGLDVLRLDAALGAEAARIQYGLGRMFQTPEAARTLIAQLVGISLETKGLSTLPADAQERRKAEIAAFKTSMPELTKASEDLVTSQNEPRLIEYLRRLRTDGELSALRWLKEQQK